ncbi:MAG: hypothetical protein HYV20_07720 [Gemmatimonadetes bacterium]|nr:hypothetical protein [Gemmatimonadota bacterium]
MHSLIHIVGTLVLLGWSIVAGAALAAWTLGRWRRWREGRAERALPEAVIRLPKETPGGVRVLQVATRSPDGRVRVHYRRAETPVDPWELPPEIRDLWLHARLALMRREPGQ